MKSYKLISIAVLLLLTRIVSGQYSNINLSSYKLPDIKLDRLDASFNAGNSLSSNRFRPSYSDSTKTFSNTIQGTANIDYYHFRNTERYQGSYEVTGNLSLNNYNNKPDNASQKSNSSYINFVASSDNRFYNSNLKFIEADPEISVYSTAITNHTKQSTGSTTDVSTGYFTANFSVPVSVGTGRIEPVEDMRLAVYILEELNKAGRADSIQPENVVVEMAKVISKIKRQRFFDTRLRKIRELNVIDSFLVANKIVSKNDIGYFAVLNDQWDYAAAPARSAGFAFNLGLDDYISLNRSHSKTIFDVLPPINSEYTANTFFIGAFAQARYEKPVNLYWQSSFSLRASYGFEFMRNPNEDNDIVNKSDSKVIMSTLAYSIRYLPDSRTSVGLNFSGNYIGTNSDINTPGSISPHEKQTDNQFVVNTSFNMYYYLSPQLRIQLNAMLYYNTHSTFNDAGFMVDLKSTENNLRQSSSIVLTYSFF